MASVNKFIGLGTLGRAREVRYSQGGDAVANFSIACTERWKDKSGEKQEKTEWVRCVAFGRTGEVAGEYLRKGNPVYVEGRLQTRQYEKDGQKHYSTEVVVDKLQLLGGNRDGGDGAQQRTEQQAAAARSGPPQRKQEDFDDDIPF